jgi:protein-L-isoaspartate O-methyltransferase
MTGETMNATYSPEDNKLRLYAETRLSKEDYLKIKAAGFSWAPKQELFVAPMWTPEREDLLLKWCGEIEDEDKSLVERAEERADRFGDYSDNRKSDAESAREGVAAIADNIPLGQPILVGHHSEKRARKDAERIENGMRKAVKMWEQAEYWKRRASSAISHAKYKERPDVRARRIKKIEADKRGRERARHEAENLIRFWEGNANLTNRETGEKRPLAITEENRALLCKVLGNMSACGVSIRGIDGQNWYSAWNVLRPDEERYKNCPVKTVAELQAIALRLQAEVIARCDRWLAHYDNRLAYERAMLEADGGTATDKIGPEKGGAVKCRASVRGCWSYIQKVNKVSVTVLDNWGNGGKNFTRTIPFDKCFAIMTAAQVQEARRAGRLVETSCKTGFGLCDEVPKLPVQKQADPQKTEFDAMRETLKTGVQVISADQLFPTPASLARRMVQIASIQPGQRVLEPSAGTGAIASEIARNTGGTLLCVEINRALADGLTRNGYVVECADFLQCNGQLGAFDRIVMNPPFANGQDIAHIKHALTLLNPAGILVALCANGPRQQTELQPMADQWTSLEPGTFKESGTMVSAALLVIRV